MKVALIVPGGVDASGEYRVIPCLLWLIERLARVHEVHVFALSQPGQARRYPLLGARVHVAVPPGHRVRLMAQVLGEHRAAPFRLIHAIWAHPPGVLAAALGKLLRAPVLLHLTGGDLASLPEIGYGTLATRRGALWLRLAVSGAAHVTTPSSAMREAAARLGIRAERLPFGVALDRWPPLAPRRRDPAGSARLLHVGSLNLVKDQATLLRAVRLLTDQGVSVTLDIVGGGALRGELERLNRELGLEGIVRFHGFLPHRLLRPLVEAACLLVVSSRHEADPIVMLEAAVAGVPAVGTAVGHLTDWAPEAALAVPPGDAAGLCEAAARVLGDEEARLRMAHAAQRRAVTEDADRTAERVLALYEELALG